PGLHVAIGCDAECAVGMIEPGYRLVQSLSGAFGRTLVVERACCRHGACAACECAQGALCALGGKLLPEPCLIQCQRMEDDVGGCLAHGAEQSAELHVGSRFTRLPVDEARAHRYCKQETGQDEKQAAAHIGARYSK